MRAFIITSLCMAAFGILLRLGFLAVCDYPRKHETDRGTDAIMIVIAIAWCLWALHLLTE